MHVQDKNVWTSAQKNFLPVSRSLIDKSSSKLAPAQKARSPADFNIITLVAVSLPEIVMQSASPLSNFPGSELLIGCSKVMVAIPFSTLVDTDP